MRDFYLESGSKVDPLQFTKEILERYPDTKIYIGCDSQNKERVCVYATVIAYRFTYVGTRRGARYIYYKEVVDKTKDKFTRLWGEVERSLGLAVWLRDQGFDIYQIDLDFNEKSNTGSHDMVASGTGYVIGQGFNCTVKPQLQCASRCADHIVKKRVRRRRQYKKKAA